MPFWFCKTRWVVWASSPWVAGEPLCLRAMVQSHDSLQRSFCLEQGCALSCQSSALWRCFSPSESWETLYLNRGPLSSAVKVATQLHLEWALLTISSISTSSAAGRVRVHALTPQFLQGAAPPSTPSTRGTQGLQNTRPSSQAAFPLLLSCSITQEVSLLT